MAAFCVARGSQYNELVFDDATDQERVRLNSENAKSQLNLGYLIHQTGNTRGAFRGTGFELRSDAFGAVRAHQGLYLTSWGQPGASGDQLDLTPAYQQLDSAWQLTDSLSQTAQDHNAETLDTRDGLERARDDADDTYGNSEMSGGDQSSARAASESGGRGEAARMKAPWLHLASPAGITMSTPESTHLAQGRSLSISSGEDVNIATGKSLVASISEKLSLFVYRAGIKLFAAKGKVEIQAQDDDLAFTAEKGVRVTATEGRIEVNAENGILLQSGGGYIRIEGGNIDVHCPGMVDVKAVQHAFGGPTSLDRAMPERAGGALSLFPGAVALVDGLANRCSACEPAVGSPVNPLLGAKLLPAETDFALPAPRPFVFARGYLSCNDRIGPLGQGWSTPGVSLCITLRDDACILHDAQGREITFGRLAPGQERFSPTEQLWVRRGNERAHHHEALPPRWAPVAERLQQDARVIAVADGTHCYLLAPRSPGENSGESSVWRLARECDRNGYATDYHWQGDRLAGVTDSAGRHYGFHYAALAPAGEGDSGERLTGVRLDSDDSDETEGAWLVHYDYSDVGDLIAVRHRDGRIAREFAWRHHMLVAHRVPGGPEARYTWDHETPQGRVLTQQESGGLTRHFDYRAHETVVTDSLDREERYHFAGEGPMRRWVAHTRADGSRIEYRHDRAGQLIATLDPLGRQTQLERDRNGRVVATTDPAGQRWTIDHDELGLIAETSGPDNLHRTIERDARGNPLSVTDPAGTTRYAYANPALPDRPTTITDPGGSTRQLEWNALGQPVAETDCSQHRTHYGYDDHDHLAAITNALGETTRFTHDLMGRQKITRLPDDSEWHALHDDHGRFVGYRGPQNSRQQLVHDARGRVTAATEGDGRSRRADYDSADRLIALRLDNGDTHRFIYDVMDRPVREIGTDGREQHFAYDAAGQQIARTEMNRLGPDGQPLTTRYDYDALGRLQRRHLPATEHAPATTEVFHWRADGQLASADNAHGEVLFVHDDAGRMAGESQRHFDSAADLDGHWQWQTRHTLTAHGALQQSRLGDTTLHWLTYGSGHLQGLNVPDAGLDIAFGTDALHRERQRRFNVTNNAIPPDSGTPQPLVLERGYSATGQLTRLALDGRGGHLPLLHQHFRHDAAGRPIERQLDEGGRRHLTTWTHDGGGHLIAARHDGREQRYPLDAAGHHLADSGRDRHDGAGNLIERHDDSGHRLQLGYDAANRLVRLTRTDSRGRLTRADYRYDPLGRRIRKSVHDPDGNARTTHYGWDGDCMVHAAPDTGSATTLVYEPGSVVPLLRLDAEGDTTRPGLYLNDPLGTPLRLLAADGTVRWRAQPHDWAAVRDEVGETQSIRFQGQWHDEESGLYYNRHRYYDPQAGRYISQDPIGLMGGLNLYGYAADPVSMVDPMGLAGFNALEHMFGPAARHARALQQSASASGGEVLTGGRYNPGIGALFPSGMSGFARSSQDRAALAFQGATRNDLSLPAASGALAAPMIAPGVPAAASATANAASALASGANTLSLRAMCSVSRVSPSAAVGLANPALQGVAMDFIDSAVGGTNPTPNVSGASGYFVDFIYSPKESLR